MPISSNTVTFLFAGDGSLASEGLSVFLQTKSNFIMVAECNDGASAVAGIKANLPAIAVIDAQLPDMTAAQIIEAVRSKNHTTKIIVLGASADREAADQLLAMGADAYVVRNGPSRFLNDAIRYVRDGGKYLAPELTRNKPLSKGRPATATACSAEENSDAVARLRHAVEAQGRTVERLENAMERAQNAIELLQQKVEQLSGPPAEPQPAAQAVPQTAGEGRPSRSGLKARVGAVAAALMLAAVGIVPAGILRPSAKAASVTGLSGIGSQDARPQTAGLAPARWENETIEKAAGMLRNHDNANAEKLCRALLKQDPANQAAERLLASALFHQNRIDESAEVIRSMATPAPRAMTVTPHLPFEY